jgi:hypothetical protein
MMRKELLNWLLYSDEPWTRYRVLLDLLGLAPEDEEVKNARRSMLAHPQVQELIKGAAAFAETTLTRHNDARHPIYMLSTLADFGVQREDKGMKELLDMILQHQSLEGAFLSWLEVPVAFGGSGKPGWTWMACDAPTLLYTLLSMGIKDDPSVQKAVSHLTAIVDENGWRCRAAPELGKFRGPGRKEDICPVANVYALKALSLIPQMADHPAVQAGIMALLQTWEQRKERKPYLFGTGTDFRKLKYPYVYYDILHTAEALSRFPAACSDARFKEMLEAITAQADKNSRYTAASMYMAWKGWSFANKKDPSPWLTFLVLRILKRSKSGNT